MCHWHVVSLCCLLSSCLQVIVLSASKQSKTDKQNFELRFACWLSTLHRTEPNTTSRLSLLGNLPLLRYFSSSWSRYTRPLPLSGAATVVVMEKSVWGMWCEETLKKLTCCGLFCNEGEEYVCARDGFFWRVDKSEEEKPMKNVQGKRKLLWTKKVHLNEWKEIALSDCMSTTLCVGFSRPRFDLLGCFNLQLF